MRNRYIALLMLVLTIYGCKKNYDELATYANWSLAQNWAKTEPFYRPKAEIFLDSTNTWRSFQSFSYTSAAEPDKLGFGNTNVPGKGSNALYMTTIYDRLPGGLTSDSGYYNVTIPKVFQLVPTNEAKTEGTVTVLTQKVRLFRRDKTSYEIGITGGSGTFNTVSQLLEVQVVFDETAVGGPAAVTRKYRFRP